MDDTFNVAGVSRDFGSATFYHDVLCLYIQAKLCGITLTMAEFTTEIKAVISAYRYMQICATNEAVQASGQQILDRARTLYGIVYEDKS